MKDKVKFAILADFHQSMFPDSDEKIKQFIEAVNNDKEIEFVVDLGDLCFPIAKKNAKPEDSKAFIDRFNSAFNVPVYHVLGNHECDYFSKKESLEFHGFEQEETYYSFDVEPFHFVVLDGNFMKVDGKYEAYENRNYYKVSGMNPPALPFMPDFELEWLREDLAKAKYPTVLFCHQNLTHGKYNSGIMNSDELKEIFKAAPNGVVLSVNGHEHEDYAEYIDGVWYYSFICGTHMYMGSKFPVDGRFPKEIEEEYVLTRYICPFDKTQYGIITLDKNGAFIKGTDGGYMGPAPSELGYPDGERFLPYVTEKYLEFK